MISILCHDLARNDYRNCINRTMTIDDNNFVSGLHVATKNRCECSITAIEQKQISIDSTVFAVLSGRGIDPG
jgi:hypothetical protein